MSFSRTLSAVQGRADQVRIGRVVTIGASNAGKTATALVKGGISVLKITRPGWAVTKDSVEAVMQEVESEKLENDIMLIQWMDNSSFFMVNEDTGNMALPDKGEDDIYHVTGRVQVAKDMQLDMLLVKLEPLLKCGQRG